MKLLIDGSINFVVCRGKVADLVAELANTVTFEAAIVVIDTGGLFRLSIL